jgi:hypothetical protein
MTPQLPLFRVRPLGTDPAARALPREDARWVRPTFRPPPLEEILPIQDLGSYLGTIQRTEPWADAAR